MGGRRPARRRVQDSAPPRTTRSRVTKPVAASKPPPKQQTAPKSSTRSTRTQKAAITSQSQDTYESAEAAESVPETIKLQANTNYNAPQPSTKVSPQKPKGRATRSISGATPVLADAMQSSTGPPAVSSVVDSDHNFVTQQEAIIVGQALKKARRRKLVSPPKSHTPRNTKGTRAANNVQKAPTPDMQEDVETLGQLGLKSAPLKRTRKGAKLAMEPEPLASLGEELEPAIPKIRGRQKKGDIQSEPAPEAIPKTTRNSKRPAKVVAPEPPEVVEEEAAGQVELTSASSKRARRGARLAIEQEALPASDDQPEMAAPKTGRGRQRKSDIQPESVPEEIPKTSRNPKKVAVPEPSKVVEKEEIRGQAELTSAPSKRSRRGAKLVIEQESLIALDEQPEMAAPSKGRGRPRKSDIQPESVPKEIPKTTRNSKRPAKVVVPELSEVEEIPGQVEPMSLPSKRARRGAKLAIEQEALPASDDQPEMAAPSKGRGRPRKSDIQPESVPEEIPKTTRSLRKAAAPEPPQVVEEEEIPGQVELVSASSKRTRRGAKRAIEQESLQAVDNQPEVVVEIFRSRPRRLAKSAVQAESLEGNGSQELDDSKLSIPQSQSDVVTVNTKLLKSRERSTREKTTADSNKPLATARNSGTKSSKVTISVAIPPRQIRRRKAETDIEGDPDQTVVLTPAKRRKIAKTNGPPIVSDNNDSIEIINMDEPTLMQRTKVSTE
jgi:hypothetical protein